MNTMQQGGPRMMDHRCIVAYRLGFLRFSGDSLRSSASIAALIALGIGASLFFCASVNAGPGLTAEDYAQVYVNQYFEPNKSLTLSPEGKNKSEALARYSQGRSLEAKGRPLDAVKAYRAVLKNQPDQFFLARKTAYILARSGQTEEAEELLEESLKQNPEQPYAYISLSEFLATYQNDITRKERAFEIINDAVSKFPDEAAVYEHLVKLFVASGKRTEAREVVAKAATRDNSDPIYWLRLGKIAGQVWNAQRGAPMTDADLLNSIYAKALQHAGSNWAATERVGDFYHATAQFDRAIHAYTQVLEANPDNLSLREKLAAVYGGKGDEEKVISTLAEIVEIDPENAGYRKKLAGVYMRLQRFKEAVPHLVKAFEISKGSLEEYRALGEMMMENAEPETTIKFVDQAIYQFPEAPEFPLQKARALAGLKKWEEAIAQYKLAEVKASDERPDLMNEGFYFQYAAAEERSGNLKVAETLFRKTMSLIAANERSQMPDDVRYRSFTATTYNYLGYMWLENGLNVDEAGELIKTAADLDPDSGAIADSLGWFHFVKGDYEAAKGEMERAIAQTKEENLDGVIYDHMAQVQYALGEKSEAIEFMKKAIALSPEEESFKTRLAEFERGEPFKPFVVKSSETKVETEKADETPAPRKEASAPTAE